MGHEKYNVNSTSMAHRWCAFVFIQLIFMIDKSDVSFELMYLRIEYFEFTWFGHEILNSNSIILTFIKYM